MDKRQEKVFRGGLWVCAECGYADGHSDSCSRAERAAPREGDLVTIRLYGTGPRVGRLMKVGRVNGKVRVTLADGREKIVTRPLADMTPWQR